MVDRECAILPPLPVRYSRELLECGFAIPTASRLLPLALAACCRVGLPVEVVGSKARKSPTYDAKAPDQFTISAGDFCTVLLRATQAAPSQKPPPVGRLLGKRHLSRSNACAGALQGDQKPNYVQPQYELMSSSWTDLSTFVPVYGVCVYGTKKEGFLATLSPTGLACTNSD